MPLIMVPGGKYQRERIGTGGDYILFGKEPAPTLPL
jgi:hypothetical protein